MKRLAFRATGRRSVLYRMIAVLFTVIVVATGCPSDSGDDGTGDDGTTTTVAPTDDGDDMSEVKDDMTGGDDMSEVKDDMTGGDDTAMVASSLLNEVKDRGELRCGVSGSAVAFSETAPDGSITGFDADFCKVVAAAILGEADQVEFRPLEAAERFTALVAGDVDVLIRNTTWTQSRDTDLALDFGPTTYFDGQQLMARAGDGFSSDSQVVDIDGATVCTNAGTTTEKNIGDAETAAGIDITLKTYTDFDKVTDDFIAGGCDVVTTDGSALVGRKAKQQPADQEWVIFPPSPISKEPLGPVYNQNDSDFGDVVNWAVYATIIADEKGITQENVDSIRDEIVQYEGCVTGSSSAVEEAVNALIEAGTLTEDGKDAAIAEGLLRQCGSPPDAETARLLGLSGELQTAMGLSADAFYQVIKQVGNYNDIFTRNLVPVGITRDSGSVNASYTEGGLIYAPPAR